MSETGFLGRGWAFPPTFDRRTGTAMVADAEDIQQSLEVLLHTLPGERVMLSAYGTDLNSYMFEPGSRSLQSLIESSLKDAINAYEPRIILQKISVDIDQIVDGKLLINLDYSIIGTNTRNNIVFPYYFQEGTLLESFHTQGF
ncbi:MAG: GPW/gp25 family protein [Bacteroidota bacterium]